MVKHFSIFLVGLCLGLPLVFCDPGAAPVVAQEAPSADELIVKMPKTCNVGELVRLDARASTVDGIAWKIKPETPNFEVIEDGRRAFFSSGEPGEYLIIVAGAKGGVPFLFYEILTVEGLPIPATGLAKKVGEWVKLVDNPDKAKLAQMAGVFKRLATSDTEVEKMLEATALANSAVLGDSLEKWIPFLDKLGTELDRLVDAGELATREQYTARWLEISRALERAAE